MTPTEIEDEEFDERKSDKKNMKALFKKVASVAGIVGSLFLLVQALKKDTNDGFTSVDNSLSDIEDIIDEIEVIPPDYISRQIKRAESNDAPAYSAGYDVDDYEGFVSSIPIITPTGVGPHYIGDISYTAICSVHTALYYKFGPSAGNSGITHALDRIEWSLIDAVTMIEVDSGVFSYDIAYQTHFPDFAELGGALDKGYQESFIANVPPGTYTLTLSWYAHHGHGTPVWIAVIHPPA